MKRAGILLLSVLLLYCLFLLSWGLNYTYRSFISDNKLDIKEVPEPELERLSLFLIRNCTAEKSHLFEKSAVPSGSVFTTAISLYQQKEPGSGLQPAGRLSLKPSLFGPLMSYMGVSGYFNPFTGEAQVNSYIPGIELPFTACHELAHEMGYGYEYEANMLGYLVAVHSQNPDFRYSAHLQALLYVLPELRHTDSLKFKSVIKTLTPAVLRDIRLELNFWRKYQGETDRLVSFFYTGYLKANKQPQGMRSYSDFVPLLDAWYLKNGYPPEDK